MPRYYFNVMDDRAILDSEGVDLADIAEARVQAIRTAGEILTLELDHHWTDGTWGIVVADETGTIVFSLSLTSGS